MSYFPCRHWSDCVPPAEGVAVRNFSAEGPDRFTSFGFYQCSTEGTNPPFDTCESPISQAAADQCAARCLADGIFVNEAQTFTAACGSSFTVPAGTILANSVFEANNQALKFATASANALCLFGNAASTCSVICQNSAMSAYTVPANSFRGPSQAIVNQQAAALACETANLLCFGTLVSNAEQSCSIVCQNTNGTATVVIPAGTVLGFTVESANARALELACALALIACDSLPPLVPSTVQSCSQICDGETIAQVVPAGAFVGLTQEDADLIASVFCFLSLSAACQRDEDPPVANVGNGFISCSVACAGGGTYTNFVSPNSFRLENRSAADAAALSYCQSHLIPGQFCLGDIDASACVNSVYASAVSATGATAMGVTSGSLPPGLSLSGGLLAGIATTPGSYTFTITAVNAANNRADRTYTINIGEITPDILPDGEVGTAYAVALTATGFTGSVTWSIVGGALPDGLVLLPFTGGISGTPTTEETAAFVVQATDGNVTCLKDYTVVIAEPAFCASMAWGAPVITPSAPVPGTGSATASQCTFHLEATAPGFPDSAAGNQVVQIDGQQFYTGPAINLNLHLIVSGISGNMANSDIEIELDGNPLVTITNEDVNGTYDFPFTIPVSVAAQFTVQALMVANGSAGPVAGVWDGVITVVP